MILQDGKLLADGVVIGDVTGIEISDAAPVGLALVQDASVAGERSISVELTIDPGTLNPQQYMRLFGTPKPDNLAVAIARAIPRSSTHA